MTEQPARRPDEAAAEPDKAPASRPTEEAKVAELVETLARESAENKDKLLRTLAEMENLRRRTERDVADARKYAVTKFAGDMLVVGDNLRRALGALPPERRQSADEAIKALLDGVEMTEREMDRLLEKNGVTRIAAKGERFDPNRHQAMFEVPDPSVPAGTVTEVVQEGYAIGDRVLRAALVGVSTGGPKPAGAEAPNKASSAG